MNRRTFHKFMTAAMIGTDAGQIRGQETESNHDALPRLDSFDIEPRPKEPLTIRNRKQLFVDRFIVDHTDEVLFTLMPPQKHLGNPILSPDVSSDGQMIIPVGVRWDEQRRLFQLWYEAIHFEAGEKHFTAYAESDDGLRWRRPKLGIREFNGSSANNLLDLGISMLIFDAHDTDANRRYKAVTETGMGGRGGFGVGIWFSGDGIHWTPSARNPVLFPTGDTHSLLGWDEQSKKYIGYFRPSVTSFAHALHGQRRQIGVSFSDDAENWTRIVPIIVADEHDPWGTEFYWLHAVPYENVYIGVLSVLHVAANLVDLSQVDPAGQEQTVNMQLVCSRDGVHWDRMGNRAPWLSPGPYQSWDDEVVWPSVPILVGDEIRIYYGGTSLRHTVPDLLEGAGKKYEGRTRVGAMGLATLRRDGWVAIGPNLHRRGVLTTRSFVIEGSELDLNADASEGKILVELLGADGRPLPGFSGTEAPVVSVDSVRHQVKWQRPLGGISRQAVRLRFTLENSKLYAFQFRT